MGITVSANADLTAWEGTATDSVAMPTSIATKTFNTQTGKNFTAADTVQATATAAVIPTGIIGTVSSYNSGTGALVMAPNNSVATNATICGVYGLIWSKTTVTNGTGAKTLNVSFNPYKVSAAALTAGLAIRVHSRVNPFNNFMVGTITSYTASTGALVLNITSATGSSSISDWIICQDGTFTAWNISPQWGDTITINAAYVLTITQTPKMGFKHVNALTNAQLRVTNSSTSTMLLLYGNEPTGANNANATTPTGVAGLRFEQNALLYIKGDFIVLGTATGAANETFAVPAGIDYPSYVEVETGVGTGVYEPYKCGPIAYDERPLISMIVRKTEIAVNGGDASKWLFWNPTTRNFESGDGSTGGITLTAGVRVRIPNIHVSCDMYSPNVVLTGTGSADSAITGSIATGGTPKAVSFTVATGLNYAGGGTEVLLLEYPGLPGVYLNATVTTYSSVTGAMTVQATGSSGTYTGTGWVLRDQRGALTVGDWSSNSGTASTNGRSYNQGEILSSSGRTNGAFAGIGRNNMKEWSLPSYLNSAGGSLLWYSGAATGSGGSATWRWQIDCAPSGTVYLENVSTHFLSLDLTDYSALTLLRVGAEHPYLRSSLGSTTINRLHVASVATPKQYHGLRATSLIGATSLQNIFTWTDAPEGAGNATACFTLSNIANCVAWNNIQMYNTTRQRGFQIGLVDTITFAAGVIPTNTFIVGALTVTGLSNQEWEGLYLANKTNGNAGETGEAGINHINIARSSNLVFRKLRGIGTMKVVNNQIFSGDAFSYNIFAHDGDFSANSNASLCTGLCSNSGTSNMILANWVMGPTAAAFTNTLSRSGSGLVEKNLTFRRILSTSASLGSYGDNNGIPYANGLQLEMVSAVSTYIRTVPTTNLPCPSYKDAAGFYTLIDPGATTGRLSIGAFSGESSLDLYDLTGSSYINNAGLAYFEGSGDTIVVKAQFAIRGITSFRNIDPIIMDGRISFTTYTTSVSSVTIGTGSQSFTVGSGLALAAGDPITIVSTVDTRNAMSGTVTSYSGTALVVNITSTTGSGTIANWQIKGSFPSSVATYEFRYCQWGGDINGATWSALTGANLAGITVSDNTVGINMQIRVTGVGALASRYLQQIVIFTNNNSSFNPPVTTCDVAISGGINGSTLAVYDTSSGSILRGTATVASNTAYVTCPAELYGVATTVAIKLWLYGYIPFSAVSSYYNANIIQPVAQIADTAITQANVATVAAYTDLTAAGRVYDYSQYYAAANLLDRFCSKAGPVNDFGSYNVTFNGSAGAVLGIVGNTITLKAATNPDGYTTLGTITATLTTGGSYTYTAGTMTGGTAVPTLAGGTIGLTATTTYTFSSTGATILACTPPAPGTYTINGTHSGTLDLRNLTANAITISLPNATSYTTANNTGGTITVVVRSVTYTLTIAANVSLVGAEIRLYDLDNIPAGSYGTELDGVESSPTATRDYSYTVAPNTVLLQIMQTGYVEYIQQFSLPLADSTVTANLVVDVYA